jgi:hypothetical protein
MTHTVCCLGGPLLYLQDNPLGALGVQKLLKAVHEGELGCCWCAVLECSVLVLVLVPTAVTVIISGSHHSKVLLPTLTQSGSLVWHPKANVKYMRRSVQVAV